MKNETSGDAFALHEALRGVRVELSVLNHHVGALVGVRDTDFDCLDLVSIHGPISPGALARLAGVHPATMTGVLDRLERGGWITRERDAQDRRAVVVRTRADRDEEVQRLYDGINRRVTGIRSTLDDAELAVVIDVLRRVEAAARDAVAELAED